MTYIFVDFEYNQYFHFPDRIDSPSPRPKTGTGAATTSSELNESCPFEIIEIGAVKTNESLEILSKFNMYIKPEIYTRMHPWVKKLTGITMSQLDKGTGFSETFYKFVDFIDDLDYAFFVWGPDDLPVFTKNLLYHGIDPTQYIDKFVNVQNFAATYLKYSNGGSIGLKSAVEALNIPIEGVFHNALCDAEYTELVFEIVKPSHLEFSNYSAVKPPAKTLSAKKTNHSAMFNHIEKIIGRRLSSAERGVAKLAYRLGRERTHEL